MSLLLIVVAVFLFLALYTELRRRRINARHKPAGTLGFVDRAYVHYVRSWPPAVSGDVPRLLFIHGASGNLQDLHLAFAPHFKDTHEMLFVDRPGLGFSERNLPPDASPRDQARRIAALLKMLDFGPAVVIGHSFGASVAAALALEAPERVRGLVFLAPATHPWNGGVAWYYKLAALPVIGELFCRTLALPAAERLAPASMRNVFAPASVPEGYDTAIGVDLLFRPESFRANAMDLAAFNRHLAEQCRHYGAITQPALAITGDQDTVVWPSIHSKGLARDLPNCRLIELPGAGHMPQHSHTEEIVALIRGL
ncbi:alpha/beta fold hydrolase [Pannonibacter phragmitetus]|uniref:alpha/beta fold hydrolase n=1 Tax=Pannonibacter phragmitetus TaxID=121719 RepID=UPI001FFD97AC|nr:alpha/beta hydrolase [Pannonibacter phragmitetus]